MTIKFFPTEPFNTLPKLVFLSEEPDMGKGYSIASLSSLDTHFPHQMVTSPEECDFFLVTHYVKEASTRTKNEIQKRVNYAKQYGKKVCVFLSGDYADKVWFPDALIFKMTQYKSQKKDNEIIMPPVSEDLSRSYPISFRSKSEKPHLGFCGWASVSFVKFLHLWLAYSTYSAFDYIFRTRLVPKIKGVFFRMRFLELLRRAPRLATSFIVRNSFSGRLDSVELDPNQAREEFVSNIISTDFSVCVKGDGNHSVRFFESLSLGRPIVLLDTDVVLPLEKTISYTPFVIRIPYTTMQLAPQYIERYWTATGNSAFEEAQGTARDIYQKYLTVPLFLSFVFKRLKEGYTADTL